MRLKDWVVMRLLTFSRLGHSHMYNGIALGCTRSIIYNFFLLWQCRHVENNCNYWSFQLAWLRFEKLSLSSCSSWWRRNCHWRWARRCIVRLCVFPHDHWNFGLKGKPNNPNCQVLVILSLKCHRKAFMSKVSFKWCNIRVSRFFQNQRISDSELWPNMYFVSPALRNPLDVFISMFDLNSL